jgi:hypothetical protein
VIQEFSSPVCPDAFDREIELIAPKHKKGLQLLWDFGFGLHRDSSHIVGEFIYNSNPVFFSSEGRDR